MTDRISETIGYDEAFRNRDNYEIVKITDYHFRYTYVFTEADYQRALQKQPAPQE